eukprot:COSAG02_NODE_3517_length_6624_cov_16.921533_8_plen_68_part_00
MDSYQRPRPIETKSLLAINLDTEYSNCSTNDTVVVATAQKQNAESGKMHVPAPVSTPPCSFMQMFAC